MIEATSTSAGDIRFQSLQTYQLSPTGMFKSTLGAQSGPPAQTHLTN